MLRRHAVWLLVILCYVYPFPYFEHLNNPNENVRVWMTRAVVEYGQLDITPVTRDWGFVNDKAVLADRLFSAKAPGASFAGVPVLFAQTQLWHLLGRPSPSQLSTTMALRLFSVTLPIGIFLWFFARYVERVSGSTRARDLLVLGLGVGTPMYPYSLLFVGHAQGAALVFVAYAMLVSDGAADGSESSWRRHLLGGFAAGAAVFFEYQLVLVAAILGLWVAVRRPRELLSFVGGALPWAAALGIYHTALFGSPWSFPYGHLENPDFATQHHGTGFFGLHAPSPVALASLLFSPDIGLFAFCPFLLFGLTGAVRTLRKGLPDEALVPLAVVVALFLFQAGLSNWRGGWSVGPRYIVAAAPFLAAAIARAWREPFPRGRLILLAGLVGVSVFLCGISGAMFPHYPETYDNPVFDMTIPLLRDGYAPYNAGRLVALPGAWSMAPLAVAALAAWVIALIGALPVRYALCSVGVCVMWLLGASRIGRDQRADEQIVDVMVRSFWEPAPSPR